MAKADEHLDITVLTPATIPEYAEKTGQDQAELERKYYEAQAQNKVLYGLYLPAPWWVDDVVEEEVMDLREPGESFCSDCPDHEGCMQGLPCSMVKRVNKENG